MHRQLLLVTTTVQMYGARLYYCIDSLLDWYRYPDLSYSVEGILRLYTEEHSSLSHMAKQRQEERKRRIQRSTPISTGAQKYQD
jgi:hypothetical protein